MWCSQCQQDVPGIAVKDDGNRICCARCSGQLAGESKAAPVETRPEAVASQRTPPALDDWNLDADLAAVTRMMRTLRIDAPNARLPHEPTAARATSPRVAPAAVKRTVATPRRGQLFAWPALMLGMMAFTCGGVLLGWSFATGRGDLWTYGMPAVLAGQGLLVLGLVLQLEGLWQSNRDTSDTLDTLDRELAELRHATTLLTSTHSAPGQSFYAHVAEGASPHLLLADVKGQLDVIAMRMAEVRK
jgi:hypothetical protein